MSGRRAIVSGRGVTPERVAAYLPRNYRVAGDVDDGVAIEGTDNAGWTLDGYVIPRLASGLMFAVEVPDNSPDAVAARRAMFSGFGWEVTS